jgi:hypothetical protein
MRPSRSEDLTSIMDLQLAAASPRTLIILLSERRLSLATSAARGGKGFAFGPFAMRGGTLDQGANAAIIHA